MKRERAKAAGGNRRERAVSAGGVVWRAAPGGAGVEVVLVQTPSLRWGLPKGKRDSGERLREAALREVREETGLRVEADRKVGVVRYRFKAAGGGRKIDKEVHFWLMRATGGSFLDHDHEHVDVRWFGMADAMRRVSYRNTVDVLERAAAMLDGRAIRRERGDAPADLEPVGAGAE